MARHRFVITGPRQAAQNKQASHITERRRAGALQSAFRFKLQYNERNSIGG